MRQAYRSRTSAPPHARCGANLAHAHRRDFRFEKYVATFCQELHHLSGRENVPASRAWTVVAANALTRGRKWIVKRLTTQNRILVSQFRAPTTLLETRGPLV